jgi:transposase
MSDKISNHTVKGWKELLELIDKIRSRVGRELKQLAEFISCYEAGYDGFWLHRLLEENGVRITSSTRRAGRLIAAPDV